MGQHSFLFGGCVCCPYGYPCYPALDMD